MDGKFMSVHDSYLANLMTPNQPFALGGALMKPSNGPRVMTAEEIKQSEEQYQAERQEFLRTETVKSIVALAEALLMRDIALGPKDALNWATMFYHQCKQFAAEFKLED